MSTAATSPDGASVMAATAIPSAMHDNKTILRIGAYLLEGGAHD